ncbi:MAG: (2Fe-2S)-binding protein [Actinomycetota bacterium]|nr:(2Fe-2S)-binding protein [Actinomycetota bacterium]
MTGEPDIRITTTVNDVTVEAQVEGRTLLSDFLRHDVGLTGTHVACEHGVCGACTVLVDDQPVRSCLMLAAQVDGCRVDTVESLGTQDDLSPLQSAMWAEHGLQCGFCTPGILMTVEGGRRAGLDVRQVVEDALPGHLCRCTGYQNIRNAIESYFAQGVQA